MTQGATTSSSGQPELRIIDASLSDAVAAGCHCSLLVAVNRLDLAVLDLHRTRYLAIESFRFAEHTDFRDLAQAVEQQLNNSRVAGMPFQSVSAAFSGLPYTLLPLPLYKPGCEHNVLSFNHPLSENATATSDEVEDLSLRVVYQQAPPVEQLLKQRFPSLSMHHASTTLLQALVLASKSRSGQQVYINVHQPWFDLTVLNGSELQFHNSFRFSTPEDMAYYLLYTLEQLKLSPDSVPVAITGALKMNSDAYKLLEQYVRTLSFEPVNSGTTLSSSLSSAPKHYFFNLLNQFLCA